jgi:hypothetical protein
MEVKVCYYGVMTILRSRCFDLSPTDRSSAICCGNGPNRFSIV